MTQQIEPHMHRLNYYDDTHKVTTVVSGSLDHWVTIIVDQIELEIKNRCKKTSFHPEFGGHTLNMTALQLGGSIERDVTYFKGDEQIQGGKFIIVYKGHPEKFYGKENFHANPAGQGSQLEGQQFHSLEILFYPERKYGPTMEHPGLSAAQALNKEYKPALTNIT